MRLSIRRTTRVGCCLLLAMSPGFGQNGPTIIAPALVAPGEIVTFQVTGLATDLPAPVRASTVPLPTTLAGISVTLNQYNSHIGPSTLVMTPLPLFSVEQTNVCSDLSVAPDCMITSITGQIPFEMGAPPPNEFLSAVTTYLVVSENGKSSRGFRIGTIPANIRILTTCPPLGVGACITHADGSLISAVSPAKPGEVIVIYATGLGLIDPAVPTGHVTPASAPVVRQYVYVQFDFTPNARPAYPYGPVFNRPRPEFVGLTPSAVGLYQINVRIPDTVPNVPLCGTMVDAPVSSNLTITIGDNDVQLSFDGAALCIAPRK